MVLDIDDKHVLVDCGPLFVLCINNMNIIQMKATDNMDTNFRFPSLTLRRLKSETSVSVIICQPLCINHFSYEIFYVQTIGISS